jgi:hypothetical protein
MKNKIYLYSDFVSKKFLENVFRKFDLVNIEKENHKDLEIKNKNVIIALKEKHNNFFNNNFLLNNNVVFLTTNKTDFIEKKYPQVLFLTGPINIIKFLNSVTSHFLLKVIFFHDIKIIGEKIINLKNDLSCALTPLEKKILIELCEHKKIKKDYFLERILDMKKDIETKTAESHLTRIRKKLIIIKSNINITSKENTFFLDF